MIDCEIKTYWEYLSHAGVNWYDILEDTIKSFSRIRVESNIKAGARCSDIDNVARNYVIENGYKNNLLHRTGSGIGLRNHEEPWMAAGSDEILSENMVISIEPGIYMEGIEIISVGAEEAFKNGKPKKCDLLILGGHIFICALFHSTLNLFNHPKLDTLTYQICAVVHAEGMVS